MNNSAVSLPKVLTIAGSDSSGGAGIQADLKTMTVHRCYGMSAVTALTAQNTTGVFGVLNSDPDFLAAQLDAVFSDIRPDAVKIGMVSTAALINVIAAKLREYAAANIVVDPVMVATSGARLLEPDAIDTLQSRLLPLATVITPNIPEAELLTGQKITGRDDMAAAAVTIAHDIAGAVLVKGGHLIADASDYLYADGKGYWFDGEHIDSTSTHGTGCTLSSAIACNLAMGKSLTDSIRDAKAYLTQAIKFAPGFGKGSGPLNHMALL